MGAPDVAAQPGAGWDEAQCTAALAQLEQLQAQISDMRLAIPRIIEPFHRPRSSATYKLYADGVLGSQKNLDSLKSQWKSPELQSTFEHVKQSLGANADLSESVSIPSHGWTERARKAKESAKNQGGDNKEDTGAIVTDEDIERIVVEFRKAHPNLKVETNDEDRSIQTRFVSGSVMLKFRVGIERDTNGRHKLNAECLGTTEPFLAITRCIASRSNSDDLKYLLDMIAAYKTVKGTSCAKCGKLLDDSALTPTARRSKQVAGTTDALETVWEAFHEGCI
ncbi:uncharacterized protein J4E78_008893 [Alternaria triticimaculans]|uniref:uncharacterized protein n=1 Tax=Alternaria triticimaculans TaxID=297637 RepID=UPI0020C4FC11|nr:uncharacterized protein J4E78_008893 [Alternaria triticimaculans]KAI4647578.1 hypothetical protein J4E78_008893 [Alternaria triticimaculans]